MLLSGSAGSDHFTEHSADAEPFSRTHDGALDDTHSAPEHVSYSASLARSHHRTSYLAGGPGKVRLMALLCVAGSDHITEHSADAEPFSRADYMAHRPSHPSPFSGTPPVDARNLKRTEVLGVYLSLWLQSVPNHGPLWLWSLDLPAWQGPTTSPSTLPTQGPTIIPTQLPTTLPTQLPSRLPTIVRGTALTRSQIEG
jgi:hypothetical protein